MKQILAILLILITSNAVYAADKGENTKKQFAESAEIFNKGFEDQQAVTDTKLQKAVKQLREHSLSRKQKKMRAEVKPLSPASDEDYLRKFAQEQDIEDQLSQSLTVTIPVTAFNDEGQKLAPGYYKLSCRKIYENEYILDLSQGTRRIMSIPAKQTKQDLDRETIQFCEAEVIDDNRIRLMYGSIDLNLVGYLYFK